MGDLYDMFSWGRFPRTFNLMTPESEFEQGRAAAERFWASVRKRAPKATLYQIWGNHDDRVMKRIMERSPEHEFFVGRGMKEAMTFDGVSTVDGSRDELEIDGVLYIHGYRVMPGSHARFNLQSTVTAHTHYGCFLPVKLEHKIIWELNVGWVGDRFAKACSYTPQRRMSRWTTGYGEIHGKGHYGTFIPVNVEGPGK